MWCCARLWKKFCCVRAKMKKKNYWIRECSSRVLSQSREHGEYENCEFFNEMKWRMKNILHIGRVELSNIGLLSVFVRTKERKWKKSTISYKFPDLFCKHMFYGCFGSQFCMWIIIAMMMIIVFLPPSLWSLCLCVLCALCGEKFKW